MVDTNSNGKEQLVKLAKLEQKLDDVGKDVGYIREEIGRMCARVEENTNDIGRQRAICDERVKRIEKSFDLNTERLKLSLSAKATIGAACVAALAAIITVVLDKIL